MAPNGARTLAEQLADLEDPAPKDFDPEEEPVEQSDGEDNSDEENDPQAARDHYVDVGRSKLRKRDQVPLGPQYEGSRVSRDAVLIEEEDDPFSRGFDDVDSEEDEDASEDETLSHSAPAKSSVKEDDEAEDDEDDGTSELSDGDEDMKKEMDSTTDPSNEGVEGEHGEILGQDSGADRAELKKMLAEEQKSVAASLSQAAKADAEKGRAVKRQRRTFDDLLNTRIKLQKAMVGVNTISGLAEETEQSVQYSDAAFQAAENAAFNLWNTLTNLRESLQNPKKRKHSTFTASASTSALWTYTQFQTRASQADIDNTLQKWSLKSRGVSALTPRNRLNNTNSQTTLPSVLAEQLTNPTRLIERTRVPRSCAPLQLARSAAADPRIYDDADFYSVLLTALLEQRSADSLAAASDVSLGAGGAAGINGYQSRREAKTKKVVDTKASKGRKLRYTVHEKLENYMPPENRGLWGERQTDELFGSLFGARMGLGEDVDEGEGDEEEDGEAGLMMFRS